MIIANGKRNISGHEDAVARRIKTGAKGQNLLIHRH